MQEKKMNSYSRMPGFTLAGQITNNHFGIFGHISCLVHMDMSMFCVIGCFEIQKFLLKWKYISLTLSQHVVNFDQV